jgi:hypothetical protein
MNRHTSMHWCDHCKEQSVRIKCYTKVGTDLQEKRHRVMYCINKGCGYSQDLTIMQYGHKVHEEYYVRQGSTHSAIGSS